VALDPEVAFNATAPMKVSSRAAAPSSHQSQVLQFLGQARAPKKSSAPSAEFATVPPTKQAKVTQGVQRALQAQLAGTVDPERQAAVKDLLAHVGQPDFYETVAKYDPSSAAKWKSMAQVQRQFAKAEPGYDPKTRAYSESMRLTLHASVVQHFADPKTNQGMPLFERFIKLHPTAFHQNGGWVDNLQIPLAGALQVAQATPAEMWLNTEGLAEGSFITDAPTIRAAELVRAARREAIGSWSP
jgi:hypothetical protein